MQRNVPKLPIVLSLLALNVGLARPALACIWDADTLDDEKKAHPTLADAILNPKPPSVDSAALEARITSLRANPRENDVAWSNDLGGALLRLDRADEAIPLLEGAAKRFPDDYGAHANLGTAYHLAGRFVEAEREIRRDLEINPDGHEGLEKYHLALLQYLVRSDEYRANHLYVDEFSDVAKKGFAFGFRPPHEEGLAPKHPSDAGVADLPPEYRSRWNLAEDPKLDDGVIYMATLNPKTPAAIEMLAVVALDHRDQNLAAAAFDREADLAPPNAAILRERAAAMREYIKKSTESARGPVIAIIEIAAGLVTLVVLVFVLALWSRRKAARNAARPRGGEADAG